MQSRIQGIKEQKKMLSCPEVYGVVVAVGRWAWHYGGVGTQESGESPWLGGGDVESQVGK